MPLFSDLCPHLDHCFHWSVSLPSTGQLLGLNGLNLAADQRGVKLSRSGPWLVEGIKDIYIFCLAFPYLPVGVNIFRNIQKYLKFPIPDSVPLSILRQFSFY